MVSRLSRDIFIKFIRIDAWVAHEATILTKLSFIEVFTVSDMASILGQTSAVLDHRRRHHRVRIAHVFRIEHSQTILSVPTTTCSLHFLVFEFII